MYLAQTGEDIIFSKNPFCKKIYNILHIFINYNPLNKSNNNQINGVLLNKCITFILVPMVVDFERSAQIIYGYMKNNKIGEILCQEISLKIEIIYQEINKKFWKIKKFSLEELILQEGQ